MELRSIYHSVVFFMALLFIQTALFAQVNTKKPTKITIGIQDVQIVDAVKTSNTKAGVDKYLTLQRISQSMNQQLVDRFHNTRKFNIIARSDLNTLLKDQDLQAVLSDPSDSNVATVFKIAGCKYSLIVTVDDYQDLSEKLRDHNGQLLATKRTMRLSAIAKIFDNSTGLLLEPANFQISKKEGSQQLEGASADAKISDRLITELARLMAQKASNRVMDVLFPAKVIGLTGNFVTINRGDGTGIEKGQTWVIYATGESMIVPDTGEELGTEEVPVGKMTISKVMPKFSRGTLVENFGVEKLHVARLEDE